MDVREIDRLFKKIPRKKVLFLPTPLHKLENLSKKYQVNIFMKRDDLTGPSCFGGNKTRKLEFIVGEALKEGVEYLISMGGYQTNAGMQMVSFCRICGLKPILYLMDVIKQGEPKPFLGNLLLNKIMNCEIHYVLKDYEGYSTTPMVNKMIELSENRKKELESQGHKTIVLPSGCTHPDGWVAYVLGFKEVVQQAKEMSVNFDYFYHTTGTAGTLPGLIAGKLIMKSNTKIMSIACNPYGPGERYNEEMICQRTEAIFQRLGLEPPKRNLILDEINIDQDFIGKGYGVPTKEGRDTIREVAKEEALFLDPVYTGKGFSGLLGHIKNGKIPKESKVVFLHTGGSGALFAEEGLTGAIY
ncbi:hypothetical protein A2V47_03470 [Candidatus Atribacteria bacterium RBG_19FT_COMBO_35_14]|uniref:Tryptophan synthase beta chain-like PALP domain-containing protein n=1 Tax=Candidatus Sediminicultor quintus TaxID=1797291 RepID=A0A1F5ADC1_9BACT|nr:MAG: hypothetical protein A2V47_03470 [Candidatus Atribacteria bacterium RBG_19FT_COMBO_35_14]OGD35733.1 MAG: hypothetical protein A2V94_00875 [Candidatus Atribacteria bacterium RBG_16_35_8]